jgi:hypothetical protein
MSLSPMISTIGMSIAEMACGVISGISIAWTLASSPFAVGDDLHRATVGRGCRINTM